MLVIGATDIVKTTRDTRAGLTMLPFWAQRDLREPQERYFIDDGIDGGGKVLAASTMRARRLRMGYYKSPPRSRASSTGPYGVWTGNTFEHTWRESKARIRKRSRYYTVQHRLKRWWIGVYFGIRQITRWINPQLEGHFQAIFDGRGFRA